MPRAPVLRNTCHGPRTSIPQRVGCLPPHTDRVQQDVRPTDSPAPPAQKSGNTTEGAMSKPTETKTTPERSPPPSERGTTTSTRTPTETSRDRGTPTPPPAPPPLPRRRRDAATTRRKTTRSAPERSTPPAGVQGNYVNPHTDDDEPRPRDDHAAPCPTATAPRLPPPHPRRRAAREDELPVGSTRPLHRRAAAKMSPRIRTGPEAVLTAHAPTPSAAAATARRKPDQVPIPEQNFSRVSPVDGRARTAREAPNHFLSVSSASTTARGATTRTEVMRAGSNMGPGGQGEGGAQWAWT